MEEKGERLGEVGARKRRKGRRREGDREKEIRLRRCPPLDQSETSKDKHTDCVLV